MYKECGWNTAHTAHTTGACGVSGHQGYIILHSLTLAMKAVLVCDDDGEEKTATKKSGDSTIIEVMTAMMRQCETMKREENDPDQANFA